MRLTIRTNLAMRVLMFCATNPARTVRKHDIAVHCNASENHLAQVVNLLAHKGFLKTQRGRGGGISLGRAPETISVGEVFRAFEADLPFAECFSDTENTCPLTSACRLRHILQDALGAFYDTLDRRSLSDLVEGNADLKALLTIA